MMTASKAVITNAGTFNSAALLQMQACKVEGDLGTTNTIDPREIHSDTVFVLDCPRSSMLLDSTKNAWH